MNGLTLWRPWAWSILHAGKRIENRPWAPPAVLFGRRIALHAGKTWDYESATYIRAAFPAMPGSSADHPLGVVGVATVRACLDVDEARRTHPDQTRWVFGPCCWVLENVIALPRAVPCRGAQGLWSLPSDVERQVNEALASMKREAPRRPVIAGPAEMFVNGTKLGLSR